MTVENKPAFGNYIKNISIRAGAIAGFGIVAIRGDLASAQALDVSLPITTTEHHVFLDKHPFSDELSSVVQDFPPHSEDQVREIAMKSALTLILAGYWANMYATSTRQMEGAYPGKRRLSKLGLYTVGVGFALAIASTWSVDFSN